MQHQHTIANYIPWILWRLAVTLLMFCGLAVTGNEMMQVELRIKVSIVVFKEFRYSSSIIKSLFITLVYKYINLAFKYGTKLKYFDSSVENMILNVCR